MGVRKGVKGVMSYRVRRPKGVGGWGGATGSENMLSFDENQTLGVRRRLKDVMSYRVWGLETMGWVAQKIC